MPKPPDKTKIVKASPTKEFFVFMLTRDLDLLEAIGDLVDNCIDGARRSKKTKIKGKPLEGFEVRVAIDKTHFKIWDNCGGISVDVARNYAFRFGRAKGYSPDKHSIGQFGVGMKRALFKMGNVFRVESKTQTSRFVIRENLQEWLNQADDDWDMRFAELSESYTGEGKGTTSIEVTELYDGIASEFGVQKTIIRLREYLLEIHSTSLQDGLAISLNGSPLDVSPTELLQSDELKPAKKSFILNEGKLQVTVHLYAGLIDKHQAKKDGRAKAGWYVYCNGRLVLAAGQDVKTGWGDGVPLFHPQFSRFRGYIFFDSDTPTILPWTTTKSGINAESEVYQKARLEMITMTRPIITFLNQIKDERRKMQGDDDTETPTEVAFEKNAKKRQLGLFDVDQTFAAPIVTKAAETVQITYERNKAAAKKVKDAIGARTYAEVGEKTFDYYYDAECDDG